MQDPQAEEEEAPLEIELGEARAFEPAPGVMPSRRPECACESVGRRRRGQGRVFFSLAAWQAATTHVAGDTSQELGGILWGTPRRDDREGFLEITEASPATAARGDLGQLTFGHEAWQEVLAQQAEGRRVVGWYHSHPGFGVFLSQQDTFIHQHFFSRPWQVALVLEPVRNEWGLYGWVEEQVAMWGGMELFAPRADRGALLAERRRFRRG